MTGSSYSRGDGGEDGANAAFGVTALSPSVEPLRVSLASPLRSHFAGDTA